MMRCKYDPIPWLMEQKGLPAVRARRLLGLSRAGDEKTVAAQERKFAKSQRDDGSFQGSPMKTAGVLVLLDDLRAEDSGDVIKAGASYLLSVLQSQPGYKRAAKVRPGSLKIPCDLCGFFGPFETRNRPDVLSRGAKEMNFYRDFEPLLGPQAPVRATRRSTRDRPGPGSCYRWGLIPLSYTIEALCRAGYARDARLRPAVNAFLGVQRTSGGWCRNLGGHPGCTIHALRALGAHPKLRSSRYAERVLKFMKETRRGKHGGGAKRWWGGRNVFAALQAIAAIDVPLGRRMTRDLLAEVGRGQRKNGTFSGGCAVERVAAALVATRAVHA
jgi:hypothetical protein